MTKLHIYMHHASLKDVRQLLQLQKTDNYSLWQWLRLVLFRQILSLIKADLYGGLIPGSVFFQIEELTSSLPALQTLSSSTSSLDSSTSSTETTSPPVKRKPLPPLQGGARKALLRWIQHTATKYVASLTSYSHSWKQNMQNGPN